MIHHLKHRELKYLLSNPIDIDVIHMAQLCLVVELLRRRTGRTTMCINNEVIPHVFT